MATKRRNTKKNSDLVYAQNFLVNSGYVDGLIESTGIGPNDLVVEIGAGKGIISRLLAKRAMRVIAIEADRSLADRLKAVLGQYPNVEVVNADFFQWRLPMEPYKVFANIPFNRTAAIIDKLLNQHRSPSESYLLMQDKAAERFVGAPLGRNSQVAILLKPWWHVDVMTDISRYEFSPVPSVDAALTKFIVRKPPLIDESRKQDFRDFVVYGFNQWQPTILEAYKRIFSSRLRKVLSRQLGISTAKPSDLTIEQWIHLFRIFTDMTPPESQDRVKGAEERLRQKQVKMTKEHRTR